MTTAAQRGTTTVSDKAVRRIAERAATEALPGTAGATKGSATVRGRRAEVAVEVPLPYPAPLADTARRVQDHVARRTAQLTGLDLRAPHIGVTSLTPARAESPSADTPLAEDTPAGSTGRTPLRWWSQRRLPMALLTLSAAIACGALAFDLVLVHTGHRPPAAWRTATLDWLSRHGPSATASTVGAVAVALLGVVLIVLAVTPGRRGLLTVTSGSPRLITAVDRSALASLVEDAVRDTDGIGPVRVRAGRRRVTVRAGLAFGDRDRARSAVRDAARRVLEGCDLRRTPRLRVTVRPEPVWDDGTAPAAGPPPSADLDERSPDADGSPPGLGGAKIDLDRTPTADPDRTPTIDLDKKDADQGIYPANRGSDSGNRGSGPATVRETPTDPRPTDPRPTAPGHPPTVPGHRRPGSALVPTPDSDPSSTIPDRLASPHSPPAPASDHPQTDTDRPHLTPDDPHLAPDRPQATHDRPHITSDPNGSDPEGASR
ncbi:DUF6286 domain-containing protein [Streptomyces griseoviridis]|uniref:DUF6286 domain-containing protein n=1 Tax=Streptomyces griseoviridis TaxID=45398 RepID=UPI00344FFFF3